MKKIFFICSIFITTLSFFANKESNLKSENEKEIIKRYPCAEEWLRDVENLMDMCATYEEACVIANRAFEKCLDDMYGE